jgi:hypothetical protein
VNGGPSAFNNNKTSSTPYLTVLKQFNLTPHYKNQSFLHENYVVKGHSIKQIAASIASSKDAVSKGLRELGFKVRGQHHAHGNLSQPAFGCNVRGGKVVTNKDEATVIEQIRALHVSGQSLREIARTLEKMGIETKNKSKAWHPEMVKRVLSR